MLIPVPKTKPAELVATSGASHVVAALIFLNRFSTFRVGAGFGICNHPGDVLWLVAILFFPFASDFAVTGSVGCSRTSEAKSHPADTSYIFNGNVLWLNAVSAACTRTPFDAFIIIGEALTVKLDVLFVTLWKSFKDFLPNRMRDFHRTFVLWTTRLKTRFAHLHPLTKIISPTFETKSVTASHSQFWRRDVVAN